MKLSELSEGQAIAVEAKGTTQLNDGDFVLVGVKCVYSGGKFIPIPKRIKMIPDIFDDVKGDELVIIKRFTLLKIHN